MDYKNFQEFKEVVHTPKLAKMSGDRLYNIERNISVRISWLIYRFWPFVRPNHITGLSFLILFLVFFITFLSTDNWPPYYTIIQLVILYIIVILDKIDGELSRAKNYFTQSGTYYDYTVHLIYPFVFFFIIGHYFYINTFNYKIFYTTLFLGVISIILVALRATTFFICQEIKDKNIEIQDLIIKTTKNKIRWPFPIRFLHYLTFMIYAWTLFFYIFVIALSIYNFNLAYWIYIVHIVYTTIVILYTILWHHPRKKMMQKI